jgi:UDP-N-acetylglucosamine acyltransferase
MPADEVFIHPSATVHKKAILDSGVRVGPYSFIGQNIKIGKNTQVDAHIYLDGWTEIGEYCHFSPFSSIGTEPQDITYKGEETLVKIGDRNIFREYITVNRGTVNGEGKTLIGNDNYFMAYSHIAHDCIVGDETNFGNAATLAGHVTIGDYATISAFSGIHQFCRVGKHAFIGGFSVVIQDIVPFSRVAGGRPLHLYGLNTIGLRRRGYSNQRIKTIKDMFNVLFFSDLNTVQAVEKIKKQFTPHEDRDELLGFIQSSKRGITKKTAE